MDELSELKAQMLKEIRDDVKTLLHSYSEQSVEIARHDERISNLERWRNGLIAGAITLGLALSKILMDMHS